MRINTILLGLTAVSMTACSDEVASYQCDYIPFVSDSTNLHSTATTAAREHVYIKNIKTGATTLVSKAADGAEGTGDSVLPVINKDCTFVVYQSASTNLVSGDSNGFVDVFRYKIADGTNALVSTDSSGTQGNGLSRFARVSQDGNLIVFGSAATNLIGSDTNSENDIFLKNMTSGATTRISVKDDETEGLGVSNISDIDLAGRYVVFTTTSELDAVNDTNGGSDPDVYLRDTVDGTTTLVSKLASGAAIGTAGDSKISGDGKFIVYSSTADPIATGATIKHIYRFAREASTTTRVSKAANGDDSNLEASKPSISENGLQVTFESEATNLGNVATASKKQVYIKNVASGAIVLVNQKSGTLGTNPIGDHTLSVDSKFVVWSTSSTNLTGATTSGIQVFYAPVGSRSNNKQLSTTTAGTSGDASSAALDVAEAG